jgi:hypothetical protein
VRVNISKGIKIIKKCVLYYIEIPEKPPSKTKVKNIVLNLHSHDLVTDKLVNDFTLFLSSTLKEFLQSFLSHVPVLDFHKMHLMMIYNFKLSSLN